MAERVLDVSGLHVWFESRDGRELHAVRGVDLALHAGERLGLVGESGCGKSTVLLSIMGLLPSSASVAGDVTVLDTPMLDSERAAAAARWRDVGVVFQGAMSAFNPVMTIGRQIVEPMLLHRTDSAAAAAVRARELVGLVGLPERVLARYPHELSGGMRQRAGLAMALACKPRVLLADEPTTGLDVMVQAQILELLTQLAEELGIALLFVTHDLPALGLVCDRVKVMYAGQVVESGPLAALLDRPRHPYTRMLFAATPDIDAELAVTSIPGTPPRLDETPEGCAFCPRCDSRMTACEREAPTLETVGTAHEAACLHNSGAS